MEKKRWVEQNCCILGEKPQSFPLKAPCTEMKMSPEVRNVEKKSGKHTWKDVEKTERKWRREFRKCFRTLCVSYLCVRPSAGAQGSFQRCCSFTHRLLSAPLCSSLRSHLLLQHRRSLRVRTWSTNVRNIKRQMTKNCAVLQSASAAVTPFGGGRWLSEFSAASPRRTKWIFALGRPSPRLS